MDGIVVDKGGAFDPSNLETWTYSIKQADKDIAIVMARIENPAPPSEVSKRLQWCNTL